MAVFFMAYRWESTSYLHPLTWSSKQANQTASQLFELQTKNITKNPGIRRTTPQKIRTLIFQPTIAQISSPKKKSENVQPSFSPLQKKTQIFTNKTLVPTTPSNPPPWWHQHPPVDPNFPTSLPCDRLMEGSWVVVNNSTNRRTIFHTL